MIRNEIKLAVEAVGLWDERVFCSFQALARQIHSLPLVLPMLLPGLRRWDVGTVTFSRGGWSVPSINVTFTTANGSWLTAGEDSKAAAIRADEICRIIESATHFSSPKFQAVR